MAPATETFAIHDSLRTLDEAFRTGRTKTSNVMLAFISTSGDQVRKDPWTDSKDSIVVKPLSFISRSWSSLRRTHACGRSPQSARQTHIPGGAGLSPPARLTCLGANSARPPDTHGCGRSPQSARQTLTRCEPLGRPERHTCLRSKLSVRPPDTHARGRSSQCARQIHTRRARSPRDQ